MYKGERFNSISHLLGSVAAIAGTACLIVTAAQQGDPWKLVSFGIYGTSLILLYFFSTLYHSLRHATKAIFRRLDHLAIYLLIAGTYTPFTLITLKGAWGWSVFGIVWGLAGLGIVLEMLIPNRPRIVSIVIYVVMGWLIVIALDPLLRSLPTAGFFLLLLGGLFYTSGLFFYSLGKKVSHFHGVWHLFVISGSISHYITIYLYIA
ncbi:MAG: hemolysin III family protein [Desulfobacteraceae bacterium]|jgi:hemolysin III